MKKKIAVIIRDRQPEALRMAVGLTLANDEVNVFVMDRGIEKTDDTAMGLQALSDMGVRIYSNIHDSGFTFMDTGSIAHFLIDCDAVLPY